MNRTLSTIGLIAARETQSFFLQPLAWVVLTVMTGFMGLAFSFMLSLPGLSSIPAMFLQRYLFTTLLFWLPLLVFIPILAMRLVAEERQSGTLETMLTAPVSEDQLVIGKFLGALAFYCVMLLPFLVYLGVLQAYGEVDRWAAASGLLGMLVVGSYLLSVSLVASALTRHQIVAAIVGFLAVLAIYLVPLLASDLVRSDGGRAVASYLNLVVGMEEFARGIVDSRRLIYPLSGTVACLFITARLIEVTKGR